jgi:hypothetical protein
MKTKRFLLGRITGIAGVAVGLLLAGWAMPKAGTAFAAQEGTVLKYKMPAGQVLRYLEKQESREVGEVMGQTLESVSVDTNAYSFRAKGRKEQNYLLGVTIDDKTMSIISVQGDMSPDLTAVKGKSFDMVLSPLGAEVDVSGAEAITYQMVTGTRSVASGFKIFFPDLPARPVKIGDSWPSSFSIEEKAGAMTIRFEGQSVNTLEGFEAVDGMACARIAAKLTGSISGSGSQQGADVLFSGTLKGTDVWHFAPKEGLFVRSTSDSVTEMTVSVTGAQTMTIPTTQTRKGEVKLTGR